MLLSQEEYPTVVYIVPWICLCYVVFTVVLFNSSVMSQEEYPTVVYIVLWIFLCYVVFTVVLFNSSVIVTRRISYCGLHCAMDLSVPCSVYGSIKQF